MQFRVLIFYCLLFASGGAIEVEHTHNSTDYDPTHLDELMQSLFRHYNKEIMPRKPVIVSVNMLLLQVKTIIERDGVFESVIALFISWHDQRIKWDPLHYQNVSEIVFNSDRIWLPDVAMTNAADHSYAISKDTTFVIRVNHHGIFDFIPTGTAKTWCPLKLLTFPFDVQRCSIEFESWALNYDSLRFNDSAKVLLDPGFNSLQFSLCSYTTEVSEFYYEMSHETFSRLKFSFVVRRKSFFYLTNLIFPTATLSVVQPFVFLIPMRGSATDRVGFATTNLLTLVVFQTIVTEEMPRTSDAITTISKYIISLVAMSGWAIIESILIERLMRTTTTPPPRWLSLGLNQLCPFKFALNQSVKRLKHIDKDGGNGNTQTATCANIGYSKDTNLPILESVKGCDCRQEKNCQTVSLPSTPSCNLLRAPLSSTTTVSVSVETDESKYATGNRPTGRGEPDVPPTAKPVPKENWDDIVARIDFVMFVLCFAVEIFVPAYLFVPIFATDDPCIPVESQNL